MIELTLVRSRIRVPGTVTLPEQAPRIEIPICSGATGPLDGNCLTLMRTRVVCLVEHEHVLLGTKRSCHCHYSSLLVFMF